MTSAAEISLSDVFKIKVAAVPVDVSKAVDKKASSASLELNVNS